MQEFYLQDIKVPAIHEARRKISVHTNWGDAITECERFLDFQRPHPPVKNDCPLN